MGREYTVEQSTESTPSLQELLKTEIRTAFLKEANARGITGPLLSDLTDSFSPDPPDPQAILDILRQGEGGDHDE